MLDPKGAELLAEMVAEVGSVEGAIEETAKSAIANLLGLVQQGDMMAEIFGPESHDMVAEALEPQLLAQGMALILAGAFLMESYPVEMEAFMASAVAQREEFEADTAAQLEALAAEQNGSEAL